MRAMDPVPSGLAERPFNPRHVEGLTRGQLRGKKFQRLMRGAHWVSDQPVHHGRRVQAALLVLPPHAVVAGRSAMWFWGAQIADEAARVEVIVDPRDPGRVRSRREIDVWQYRLGEADWLLTDFGRVTTPVRTAFDVGRLGEPLLTVPLLDALVRATDLAVPEISAFRRTHPGARGCRLLDRALTMVSGLAESPPESRLRVLVLESGLPAPEVNFRVLANGAFIARVDLAWPELKVALEYDGAYHDDPAQIAKDRVRLNNLHVAGWTVIVVDRHQMKAPAVVTELIARTLSRLSR